nr:EAL domain-containing protein [Methylobacterium radiodurans]
MPASAIFDAGPNGVGEQVQAVLRSVRRHLSMDVGFISEFIENERVFRFTDGEISRGPIMVGGSDPLRQSFCHYVASGLMPGLLHDAREDPIAQGLPVTNELPVGAHLSVPLRHADGTAYGTLCCFSFTPDRTLTGRDLNVLRLCADVVSAVLQKDRRAILDMEARRARIADIVENQAIDVVYQPVYATSDGRLTAFEALSRFRARPERGPDHWFAEAAEVGLLEELEFLAVAVALRGFERIDPSVRLTLNLSPSSVLSPAFPHVLEGAPLDRVVVELTEHVEVPCYAALRAALAPLRARGLRLAIDDVGAGHATFRHVLDLSPELIKLDRSLIAGIDGDSARRALADALTIYGRRIGSEVVAEGVETWAEYAVLKEIGVTRAQGYLLGRPQPLDEACRLPLTMAALGGAGSAA